MGEKPNFTTSCRWVFNFDISDPYHVLTRLDIESWREQAHAKIDKVADSYLMDHKSVMLNEVFSSEPRPIDSVTGWRKWLGRS